MPDAVNDFVVFLSMYLSNTYYHKEVLTNIVKKGNEISFYSRYIQNKKMVERFSEFLQMFGRSKEPQIMLNEFQIILKDRIKKTQIEQAHDDYVLSENKGSDTNIISEKIKRFLDEKFEPIISNDAIEMNLIRVHLLQIKEFSDASINNVINGQYDFIAQSLINQLMFILAKTNAVEFINRNSFQNDENLFSFLLSEEADTIIGSEFSLRPFEYSNKERLDEIFLSKKIL
ncbi:MAG: hypothetical protein LUH55_14850 [Bacteroides thetaiotaomicron]|nr:hypothetical protein [Bacteroides thetaiotaomicron]